MDSIPTVKLTIAQMSGGRYFARIDQSPAGASSGHEFQLPTEEGGWYRTFLQRWQVPQVRDTLKTDEFGRELFKLILRNDINAKFAACRALGSNGGLRLLLNLDGSELARIPFELLHDGKGFLAFSDVRIERILDELPERETERGPFRRLLVVLAEPKNQQEWGHDNYIQKLSDVLPHVPGLQLEILPHATKDRLFDRLREKSSAGGRLYDFIYFVVHGEARANGDGIVILEDSKCQPDPIAANLLAVALRNQPGCFVYLNSCSTALPMQDNPFSGVAQRLMRDGNCGTVLAMQQPILADQAVAIAKSFFDDLARGKNFEEAAHWAVKTQGGANGWIVPCLYTNPIQPNQERRDRLAAFFAADPNVATFAFYHATFRMGYQESAYHDLAKAGKIVIVDRKNYKGRTHARTDMLAAINLHTLLCQMLPPNRAQTAIEYRRPDEFEDNKATHVFLFGSESLDQVQAVLEEYSEVFVPKYTDEYWQFHDNETGQDYRIENPSKYTPGSDEHKAAAQRDYAVIEKIVVKDPDRVYFILAGLQDRGTRGAGEWLAQHWEDLVRDFGAGQFRRVLEFAPHLGTQGVRVVDRKVPAK